ncbi:MAG: TraR/DksA C4-type zinc finger protein [Nocardioides sp.]|nr:TraR/DksA C4-type zinc finger protein [Nocardioides sp.]
MVPDPRRTLESLRSEALQRLATLTEQYDEVVASSRDTNADDEHDPEGATIAFERSQVGALARQTRERVAEIDAALARVVDGSYGICEVCGLPIEPERLEARPTARTHVAHAPA